MSYSIKMSILNLSLIAGLSAAYASGQKPDSVKAAAAVVKTEPAAAPAAGQPKSGASSGKSCDDLKTEIDGKLKAKGVKTFTLDIVPKADVKSEKVIGNCEAGAKVIVYKRG